MNPVRVAAVIALFLLLTACGKLESNQMGLVMAVGLDKVKNGRFQITVQVVRPADARESAGAPTGGTGEPLWTASADGNSIFEAIRNLNRFSSRRISWAHNKVIVVGEELAKADITDILDFFTRNHELRMNTWIVVTPGRASELVTMKTGMEIIPGESIDRLFRFSTLVSEAPHSTIKEVFAAFLSETSNPVMAIVQPRNRLRTKGDKSKSSSKEQVELSGTGVFRKGKMVGKLTPSESRGLLWFIDKMESGVFPLPCPGNPEHFASLELKQARFKITPGFRNDQVSFNIHLNTRLELVEAACSSNMKISSLQEQLAKEAAAKIKMDMNAMLKKIQKEYKSDVLDLGKTFQNRYPGKWKSIRKEWPTYFEEADIKLEVTAKVYSPGLKVLLPMPQRE